MALATGIQHSNLAKKIARAILDIMGWRTDVILPLPYKYVLIGAPHTSNWDFLVMLLLMAAEGIPIHWMGKDSLFRGPLGVFFRALGAIPVNRQERTNLVEQIAAKFYEYEDLVIGLSPEGTRKKAEYWRTGFYYIALKADVPIVMAYIDYQDKECGLGLSLRPTGDIETDFEEIKNFYTDFVGKHPRNQGQIRLRRTQDRS